MRPGSTLAEVGVTLALVGLMAGITVPRFTRYLDRIAVDGAASGTLALLATAREAAQRQATLATVRFDTGSATLTVITGRDTVDRRPFGQVHGVRLDVTRDSITFGPAGLGYGAANTRVVFTRGAAAETVTVSRLGRARR